MLKDGVETLRFASRGGGADGVEELFEDGIEPLDFLARGLHVFREALAIGWREFADFPFDELQVDIKRVERVADFMGDARGEQG